MADTDLLPALNPLIQLHRAPAHHNGQPAWTLHDPVANAYYKIDWVTFECLARFSTCRTRAALLESVNTQTPLHIEAADIEALIVFLNQHGLLALSDQTHAAPAPRRTQSLWSKILHGYLFFHLPLLRPDSFLRVSLPFVRPLLSRPFILVMLGLLLAGLWAIFQRMDEFTATFTQIFTAQGVVWGLISFAGLKIIHEMAHAYTATKYGVKVPHMGVAMIVMYPVLYTETTGSWALSCRKQRFYIGVAGIVAELCIAALALWGWHFSVPGTLIHSLCFLSVSIALVSSLLVNLNPLMRFDGYYMLSDYLGLDNLQHRALHFARYQLRRALFDLADDPPEFLPPRTQRFLTMFGFALLVYRFFLFAGIAALVYLFFPVPLNMLLAGVELYWFIALPVYSELRVWVQKRAAIMQRKRSALSLAGLVGLIVFISVPWHTTLTLRAVMHPAHYAQFYAPQPAEIVSWSAVEGQRVRQGDEIARLAAPALDKEIALSQARLDKAKALYARVFSTADEAQLNARAGLQGEIALHEQNLHDLQEQADQLRLIAPFDGVLRDVNHGLAPRHFVRPDVLLFRLVSPDDLRASAYVPEADLKRLHSGQAALFIPEATPARGYPMVVSSVHSFNSRFIDWAELSSLYGGPVAAQESQTPREALNRPEALHSVYQVTLVPKAGRTPDQSLSQQGLVQIKSQPKSLITNGLNALSHAFIRDTHLTP